MKRFAVLVCGFVVACNYDTGECYLRDEGGAGVGGSIITPAGAGGFGDVPPEPQDATEPPPPECLIVPDSPCNEKCLADYAEEAAKCGKIQNETQRRACQDVAYLGYKSCRVGCPEAEESQCRKRCAEQAEACEAECRKLPEDDKDARQKCWESCNNARAACIKKCKK